MYTTLLTLLIIDALVLIAAILMQAAKGGGLAASFGGATTAADAFIGTRQASNILSKTSWVCGGLFLFLAFVLQLMSVRTTVPRSVLDQPASAPAPAQSAPAQQGGTPSAIPLEPAGKAATPPAEKKNP